MAASQPEYNAEEITKPVATSELLATDGEKSSPNLSREFKPPTHSEADMECAVSPPSLRYLSSLACPGSSPGESRSGHSVDGASWMAGAARHYSSSESSDAACKHKKEGALSSPCHACSDEGEGCEKKVAKVVKGVHAKLRRKLKEVNPGSRIWACMDHVFIRLGESIEAIVPKP